jgi:hypothetical protein
VVTFDYDQKTNYGADGIIVTMDRKIDTLESTSWPRVAIATSTESVWQPFAKGGKRATPYLDDLTNAARRSLRWHGFRSRHAVQV